MEESIEQTFKRLSKQYEELEKLEETIDLLPKVLSGQSPYQEATTLFQLTQITSELQFIFRQITSSLAVIIKTQAAEVERNAKQRYLETDTLQKLNTYLDRWL